jgi:hypothetical protein
MAMTAASPPEQIADVLGTAGEKLRVTNAGNTLAPSYALLRQLGFQVTHLRDANGEPTGWVRAENQYCVLTAEDPVLLLGLIKLIECRGAGWRPTGAEVDDFLGFQAEVV